MKNKKSLGQNWLKDRAILDSIADLVFDLPGKTLEEKTPLCVEIGPGLGTLTSSLLRRFDKVVAIEFDEQLAKNLPNSFPGKNLEVVNIDFLKYDLNTIKTPYVITGNIPYYITTPIIEKILSTNNKPEKIVLLIQKEVADKICPKESGLNNSSLSLYIDNFAKTHLGPIITKEYFTPSPKVDSRIIIFTPYKTPIADDSVLDFVHKSFANPRKKLSANLTNIAHIPKAEIEIILKKLGFSANARPADLSLQDYIMLDKSIKR
ncbi:ribosomal RNA small subunit methyltransferase A [Candidatus Saccharibacteria bacterium]|nr:ribosomal RNA small subunit methyltransferase A [Candidatus Saccharibacteria bacterium]